jgi:hypothetical protein
MKISISYIAYPVALAFLLRELSDWLQTGRQGFVSLQRLLGSFSSP